jgi:hypothetical protein
MAATNRTKDFLDRFCSETRAVMREYAQSELKTAAANRDLPPGAAPIPSIESERKGKLEPPKVSVRPFKAFVNGHRRVGVWGRVEAAPEKDGRWSVFVPGGSTSPGNYYTCELVELVEVTTETDATPWPEYLAKSLSVPAFLVTERPGWKPLNSVYHDEIPRALNALESQPTLHFPPRVENRVMTLASWREMNGDVVEAEAARAAGTSPGDTSGEAVDVEPAQSVAAE